MTEAPDVSDKNRGEPNAYARNTERRLIINADDFGLDVAVNEAVERAHVDGVLTSTSLLVGAPAAMDAVERAQRLPDLRVGLHPVLADGRPLLPTEQIPALVNAHGEFGLDMVRAGMRFSSCHRHDVNWRPRSRPNSPCSPGPACLWITSTPTSIFIYTPRCSE